MKKILGIVVLGLLCFSIAGAEEKKTRLEFNDGLTMLSGDEWGGQILIMGPGTSKDGYERWIERLNFVQSEVPQKKFCQIFGLEAKPFKFKNNFESEKTSILKSKRKYLGKTYNRFFKKFEDMYSTDTYSENVLVFNTSKFECKNDKPKPTDTNNELITEIEKLKSLYEEGTLTKEQFEKAKDKLLN
tara:strand:+ start:135 stop:695 length:561 start_codon:yes stop_codon:yes gene_type:complete